MKLLFFGLLAIVFLSGCLPANIEYVTTTTFCEKSFSECEDQILFSMFEFCTQNVVQELQIDCIALAGNTKITHLQNNFYKVEIPKEFEELKS